MFLFLSKILPVFVYPLGLACVLAFAGVWLRRQRLRTLLFTAILLLLWLGSTRWASFSLLRSLEWRHLPPEPLPKAQAIVVAGGGTRAGDYPRPIPEVNEAGDRLIYAAYLYHEGYAPIVLVSGGGLDWYLADTGAPGMPAQLELLGVPAEAILWEPDSRNTYENALFSHDMLEPLGINRILLVTSAWHMPRTLPLFQNQGFELTPAPTDFQVTQADWDFLRRADVRTQLVNLLPDAYYLYETSLALKEYLGLFVYRLRGWI